MTCDPLRDRGLLVGLGLVLALVAPGTAQPAAGEVLAEIDGKPITAEEVEQALGLPFQRLQEQIHGMKRQALRGMIADRLVAAEAARRGISVQQLLDDEVTAKIGVVPEQQVDHFYHANKARFQGRSEAQAREQARSTLQTQRRTSCEVSPGCPQTGRPG